MGLAQKRFKK